MTMSAARRATTRTRPHMMDTRTLRCWHIGLPDRWETQDDGVVAFTANELDQAAPRASAVLGLHDAMRDPVPRAPRVEIHVPPYRPKSLIPVLSWLATHLGRDDAEVSWYLGKQQGPDSVRKLLEGLGWSLTKDRQGNTVRLHATQSPSTALPEPASFIARLGSHQARLAADYGVFSPDHVDDGTSLLLDVALRRPPVDIVADIGIGYGSLAIGLVLNSVAQAAVGTDVDCIALWLTEQNANAHGVPLTLNCHPDPSSVQLTPLTLCNIPTHINAEQTARFMAGLARRAEHGTLLVVVHASLEHRYTRHLTSARLPVIRHPGPAHVVLEITGSGH
jgi:16S rRNA G1207 methylase RsmC